MLKQIPISKPLISENKVTHSSVQKVESPVAPSTLPDRFIPFPHSVYGMRCWRGPPGRHDLLWYLACRNPEFGSLRQVWREIGRPSRNGRSSEVISALRTLRAHGRGGFDWVGTREVEGASRLRIIIHPLVYAALFSSPPTVFRVGPQAQNSPFPDVSSP